MILGVITAVRPHPTHPLEVEFDFGDGTMTEWLMCSVDAWGLTRYADLERASGVECLVAQIGYAGTRDQYRVLAIFPTGGLTLPDTARALVRDGAPVAITGTVSQGAPIPLTPLAHNLIGKVKGNG
jgi:hypothetical protein